MSDKQREYEQAVAVLIDNAEHDRHEHRQDKPMEPEQTCDVCRAIATISSTRVVVVESKSQEKRVQAMANVPYADGSPSREWVEGDGRMSFSAELLSSIRREAYEDAAKTVSKFTCGSEYCGHQSCLVERNSAARIRARAVEREKEEK